MATETSDTCTGPECDRPAVRVGLCAGHERQRRRHPERPLRPLAPRQVTPFERCCRAGEQLANSESEEDYTRALDTLRKAAGDYGEQLAAARQANAVRQGLEAAKERGQRLGRPPRADPAAVAARVAELGIRGAAKELHVSRGAVRRALRR